MVVYLLDFFSFALQMKQQDGLWLFNVNLGIQDATVPCFASRLLRIVFCLKEVARRIMLNGISFSSDAIHEPGPLIPGLTAFDRGDLKRTSWPPSSRASAVFGPSRVRAYNTKDGMSKSLNPGKAMENQHN